MMNQTTKSRMRIAGCAVFLGIASVCVADDGLKKPLDHDSYDQWKSVTETTRARPLAWN